MEVRSFERPTVVYGARSSVGWIESIRGPSDPSVLWDLEEGSAVSKDASKKD